MTSKILCVLFVLNGLWYQCGAQAIDNALSFKNINSDSYFRLNYENDFFSATDIYYTQGIHVELVAPWVRQFPMSRLLFAPHYSNVRYGIGLEHDGYTPTSISSDDILYGDRPFAACLFLKTFAIATDSVHHQRFSTAISTGVIGQAAGGAEMQTGIHRWLHDITPHGWQYQVHNDAIINYQADYEKQLAAVPKLFSLDASGMARAGTLSDKASGGFTLMFGYFDSPFLTETARKSNFRIYAYEHPEVDAVGYDATLQGGLFNQSSPYTIGSGNMERVTFGNRFGFVVVYRRLYLEYFQSYLSNEFKTGNYHVWGGVQIAFGL
jgi:lipid A 3-O-deacylase